MLLFLDFDGTLHPLWTFERGEESVIALPYLHRVGPGCLISRWTTTRPADLARCVARQ